MRNGKSFFQPLRPRRPSRAGTSNGQSRARDAHGNPTTYRGKTATWVRGRKLALYIHRTDIQGNIIAILDSDGDIVVEYKYDAWGNHKVVDANGNEITSSTHIGNLNPFRYRGYYYDVETGLYFLKSRYYDPEVGRFLNMDSIEYADPRNY